MTAFDGSSLVRTLVRDSWQRSMDAAVPADLRYAPMVLGADALRVARQAADWVPLALRAAEQLEGAFTAGDVLGLFDGNARMLAADGDPATLERLAAINFAPGGLWSEAAVGTNGPGTALATGRSVHIIGAEHFCETWHQWHCAAVPLRDPLTGETLGVIDISGVHRRAHPHTLGLAVSIASSVQDMLRDRETERDGATLHRFAQLADSYRGDAVIALGRSGQLLAASGHAPADLRPGRLAADALRERIAASFPVLSEGTHVGACVILEGARVRPSTAVTMKATRSGNARDLGNGSVRKTPPADRRTEMRRATTRLDERRLAAPNATRYRLQDIVGSHADTLAAKEMAQAAARNALPVLITGESGTGKELFARAIHEASDRRDARFVALNCGALLNASLDAELAACAGGTLFVDEVCELPPLAQAALLRVLQQQDSPPAGSTGSRPRDMRMFDMRTANVRVIGATSRSAHDALASGAMRRDLYYGLNVLSLDLPPLRARHTDVPALAKSFLDAAAIEVGRPALTFSPAVLDVLSRNPWPGNVRELRNLVRRLASLCIGSCITIGQLPPTMMLRAD